MMGPILFARGVTPMSEGWSGWKPLMASCLTLTTIILLDNLLSLVVLPLLLFLLLLAPMLNAIFVPIQTISANIVA